jgi:cellulose synthase (UDP-forming)
MKKFWVRLIMILSVVFSVRYLSWRLGYSFNYDALWFAIPLFLAEFHGFIEATLYFFMVWSPTKRTAPPPLLNRTVDVLIPTVNEPIDILRMTLLGCRDLTYPHKTYVLDDGRRPEVKALAEAYGCLYITREERINAKGGNLNNALKHTNSEFILTLDADHVPLPTLIDETIGFFSDEKIALVQMPQDFYNLDSFQHMTDWKKQYSWHEQELFFSVIQPGKDQWNASFYCGSTAMIRRKALDEIGGFAVETITEDIHTALRLQAKGWRSVYYNKTMARGIAPSTLAGYSIQRLRWGAGAMQVWKRNNPLTMKGLTIPQRLNYFASMYTYFDGFQKFIYVLTPILILTTGILPILTDPATFLLYFAPYFLVTAYGLSLSMGGFTGLVKVEQYNIIRIFNQMKAVIKGLFRKEKYIVTPKGSETKGGSNGVILQIIITLVSVIAVVKGLFYVTSGPEKTFYFWAHVASIFWAIFYISLTVPIVLTALKKKEHRKLYRFDGKYDITAEYTPTDTNDKQYEGSGYARNITPYGCSITSIDPLKKDQVLNLRLRLPQKVCENITGVVRRSTALKLSKNESRYINGIEFIKISDQERDEITRFLMNQAAEKQAEFFKLSSDVRRKQ